jgi:hypothetical protein
VQGKDDDTAAADRALLQRIRAAPVLAGRLPDFDPGAAPGAASTPRTAPSSSRATGSVARAATCQTGPSPP